MENSLLPTGTQPGVQTSVPESPEPISQRFLKIFGTVVIMFGLIGSAGIYFKQRVDSVPKNFDECINRSGSRLQESYPSVCITREGNYFVQEVYRPDLNQNLQPTIAIEPTVSIQPDYNPLPTTALSPCKRAGCSGQLCVEMYAEEDIFSTCEYKPEYVCYQEATCERQPDGTCGFTPSEGLSTCLQEKSAIEVF